MSPDRTLRNRTSSSSIPVLDDRPEPDPAGSPGSPATAGQTRTAAHAPRHTVRPRHGAPLSHPLHDLRRKLPKLPGGAATGPRLVLLRAALAALAASMLGVMLFAPLSSAPASTTPKRVIALRWAEHRYGKWYCWGGTGPSCFDCSGLVMKAYQHAGIDLPRTTTEMLNSSKLVRIPARKRQRGDLAFYGSGHVELVTNNGTFGALEQGTRIRWHHPNKWWHPTMYFRVK